MFSEYQRDTQRDSNQKHIHTQEHTHTRKYRKYSEMDLSNVWKYYFGKLLFQKEC